MTYQNAKQIKQQLELNYEKQSDNMKQFKKYDNAIGLTPDHIRALPEWKEAKQQYEKSFAELRNFNSWFLKTYKKEYLAERKNRWKKSS